MKAYLLKLKYWNMGKTAGAKKATVLAMAEVQLKVKISKRKRMKS
nr:hypothetical protein [uncultured Psychrobacter sp.]